MNSGVLASRIFRVALHENRVGVSRFVETSHSTGGPMVLATTSLNFRRRKRRRQFLLVLRE